MADSFLETQLVSLSVKALREFGYPGANEENIFTDIIYRPFFLRMIEGTKQDAIDQRIDSPDIIAACDSLVAKIGKKDK